MAIYKAVMRPALEYVPYGRLLHPRLALKTLCEVKTLGSFYFYIDNILIKPIPLEIFHKLPLNPN